MTALNPRLDRNRYLDILRAVAITLVFFRHTGAPILGMIGWTGVDLFFVLSGFLVSGLLFSEYKKHGRMQPGRFLIRRGFKIYPQFYALVAITLICSCFGTPVNLPQLHIGNVVREILFLQNYRPGMWWTNTWSLAVEEHFYIALALTIPFIAKKGLLRLLPLGIAVSCAVVLLLRIATWIWSPRASDYVHYFPTHLRVDSLLIGVLVSYYRSFHTEKLTDVVRRFGRWLGPISLACLSPALFLEGSHPFIYTVGFSFVAIGFATLLLMVLHSKPSHASGMFTRSIAWMGRSSYAFYLAHIPVLFLADQVFKGSIPGALEASIAFAATIVVASLSTTLIEQPCLKLRDRLFPTDARVLTAPPAIEGFPATADAIPTV